MVCAATPILDLILYGDSITEFARGTCVGDPCNQDTAAVFKHVIAEKYKAKILAISGKRIIATRIRARHVAYPPARRTPRCWPQHADDRWVGPC
jgi:hypothetical protein